MNNNYLDKKAANDKIIKKVAVVTLIANAVLTVAKIGFGAIFMNMSVLSDAVHSLTDVVTTLLVLLAVVFSKPTADKQHNYGHERVEPIMSLFFSLILAVVSAMFVFEGIKGIINPVATEINWYLIGVTIFSILCKEGMFWYTNHYAKITKSNILKADAWHHRSDSFSSIAVLIGLVVGIFIGTNLAESIAVLAVALLLIKVTIQIVINSVNQLVDKAVDEKTEEQLRQIIVETEGVVAVDVLKTRLFGNSIYVDVEICVCSSLTVGEAHKIAEAVHDRLEGQQEFPIKHCAVHVNPDDKIEKENAEETEENITEDGENLNITEDTEN